MNKILLMALVSLISSNLFAQNIFQERIWKISSSKRSVFLNKGIFHANFNNSSTGNSLKNIRSSFLNSRGYERLVFEFANDKIPQVYGYISEGERKIYIDFFGTELSNTINALPKNRYIQDVDFYSINKNNISAEISFNTNVNYDVFFLNSPGRLVIDIKK